MNVIFKINNSKFFVSAYVYTPENKHSPRKIVVGVGILRSYWEGNFSEAMLNFGRVYMGVSKIGVPPNHPF